MASLAGVNLVVTGGASGIGFATAERAVGEGARVVIWDRDEEAARFAAKRLGAEAVVCDVAEETSVAAAAASTKRWIGDVTALVNAAGVMVVDGGVGDCSPADWDRVLAINLRGPYLVSRALLPSIRAGGGTIVNISSLYGFRGYLNEAAYDASKGGIANLTRQMAIQYAAEGVRVNAVAPGEILTPMTTFQLDPNVPEEDQVTAIASRVPMRRMGRPSEVASVICFLLSAEASYVSGAIVPVDGAFQAG